MPVKKIPNKKTIASFNEDLSKAKRFNSVDKLFDDLSDVKKKGKGRPTDYNEIIADDILARITEGEGLVRICKEDEKYPDVRTVYTWLRKHKDFNHRYIRAREEQADTLADEIIDIADDGRNDRYSDKEDGFIKTDHDVIARSRLRVEARKWVAAKLKPKKYGDSTTLRGDSEAPLNPSVNVILNK